MNNAIQSWFSYVTIYSKESIRNITSVFFTLIFPVILFEMFAKQGAGGIDQAIMTSIVYCHFSVQSVMLQNLGVSVSDSRQSNWYRYIKLLPTYRYSDSARIFVTICLGLLACCLVLIANKIIKHVELTVFQQLIIVSGALINGVWVAGLALFLARALNINAAKGALILCNTVLLFSVILGLNSPQSWYLYLIVPYQSVVVTYDAMSLHFFTWHSVVLCGSIGVCLNLKKESNQ
jgi:hypothetical protein